MQEDQYFGLDFRHASGGRHKPPHQEQWRALAQKQPSSLLQRDYGSADDMHWSDSLSLHPRLSSTSYTN